MTRVAFLSSNCAFTGGDIHIAPTCGVGNHKTLKACANSNYMISYHISASNSS